MTASSPAAVNAIVPRNSTKSLAAFSGCSDVAVAVSTTSRFTRTYGKLSQEFARTHPSKIARPAHAVDQRRHPVSRCRPSVLGNSTFPGKSSEPSPLKKYGTYTTHSYDSVQAPSGTPGSMAHHLRRHFKRVRKTLAARTVSSPAHSPSRTINRRSITGIT